MAKAKDNLTRDAIAAQSAGMTYGQYMAMKSQHTLSMSKSAETTICERCGKEFPKIGKYCRKYCSERCRTAAADKRKYERKKLKKMKETENEQAQI